VTRTINVSDEDGALLLRHKSFEE